MANALVKAQAYFKRKIAPMQSREFSILIRKRNTRMTLFSWQLTFLIDIF